MSLQQHNRSEHIFQLAQELLDDIELCKLSGETLILKATRRQYQGISMDSMDAPSILYKDNHHTITNWSVMTTFKTGTKLQAVTTQFGNNIVLRDKQGKPWIPVESSQRSDLNRGSCFVRANRQFIKPIPDDPET
jgi:hypothetical protein